MDLLVPGIGLFLMTFLSVLIFVLPIIALYNLLTSVNEDRNTKLIWVSIIILLPFAGPILYFVLGWRRIV